MTTNKTPNPKSQIPKKLQTAKLQLAGGLWNWGFFALSVSLEFGIWDLGFFPLSVSLEFGIWDLGFGFSVCLFLCDL
jgi:hypothetical protein